MAQVIISLPGFELWPLCHPAVELLTFESESVDGCSLSMDPSFCVRLPLKTQ